MFRSAVWFARFRLRCRTLLQIRVAAQISEGWCEPKELVPQLGRRAGRAAGPAKRKAVPALPPHRPAPTILQIHARVPQGLERDALFRWRLRVDERLPAPRTQRVKAPAKPRARRNSQSPNCETLRKALHWAPANLRAVVSEIELPGPGERWFPQPGHWLKYAPFRYLQKRPHELAAPLPNSAIAVANQFLHSSQITFRVPSLPSSPDRSRCFPRGEKRTRPHPTVRRLRPLLDRGCAAESGLP